MSLQLLKLFNYSTYKLKYSKTNVVFHQRIIRKCHWYTVSHVLQQNSCRPSIDISWNYLVVFLKPHHLVSQYRTPKEVQVLYGKNNIRNRNQNIVTSLQTPHLHIKCHI
jgi:hypothetical protein